MPHKKKDENEIIFSLILATYGRELELDDVFNSFTKQNLDLDSFEIILVDQNSRIDLTPIVIKYSEALNIIHVKSKIKGLSYNRNLGLLRAKGKYVGFPDDDCTYYSNTLSTVLKHFTNSKANAIFGAIRDRTTNENIIRSWPYKNKKLSRFNFFSLYSSITMFCKKNSIRFNEDLGVGSYFGSYEDAEYAYSTITNLGDCYYYSDVEVWHPKIGINHFSKEKNYSYGLGFGAFCALHKFDIFIIRLFIMSLCYHVVLGIVSLVTLDWNASSRRVDATVSRIKGFIEYLTR